MKRFLEEEFIENWEWGLGTGDWGTRNPRDPPGSVVPHRREPPRRGLPHRS
ncbi:hypothetical protein JYQ62_09335 [Nostoc sp. UHCC 0702]|nr:hypothetical protein JYQ62_09335 [Nostoc sp. UHCC 0702]